VLCSLAFALAIQGEFIVTTLPTAGEPRLFESQRRAALTPALIDPVHDWEFSFYAEGIAGAAGSVLPPRARFKAYAQSPQSRTLLAPAIRTLLRIWDESVGRLNIDNPAKYGLTVHLFICDGGKAGGEQVFVRSRSARDNFASYNAIYLYHAEGLSDPVEAVREIAHEYGHAVLPPVGGFSEPEEWANGALGERLFMRYLFRALNEGKATEADVFSAKAEQLKSWLATNADGFAAAIARRRIDQATLAATGPAATNEYLGLMLLMDDLFPDLVGRALKLVGGQTAIDSLKGVVEAVNEQRSWVINVPLAYGREVWLPIAGKVEWTGAKPLQSLGAWVKVRLLSQRISARRP